MGLPRTQAGASSSQVAEGMAIAKAAVASLVPQVKRAMRAEKKAKAKAEAAASSGAQAAEAGNRAKLEPGTGRKAPGTTGGGFLARVASKAKAKSVAAKAKAKAKAKARGRPRKAAASGEAGDQAAAAGGSGSKRRVWKRRAGTGTRSTRRGRPSRTAEEKEAGKRKKADEGEEKEEEDQEGEVNPKKRRTASSVAKPKDWKRGYAYQLVFNGKKSKTSGGLNKLQLARSKCRPGRIVSKRRQAVSARLYKENGLDLWRVLFLEARKALGVTGFVKMKKSGGTAIETSMYRFTYERWVERQVQKLNEGLTILGSKAQCSFIRSVLGPEAVPAEGVPAGSGEDSGEAGKAQRAAGKGDRRASAGGAQKGGKGSPIEAEHVEEEQPSGSTARSQGRQTTLPWATRARAEPESASEAKAESAE